MKEQSQRRAGAARAASRSIGALVLALAGGLSHAQVAGSTLRATTVVQVREVAAGWSATRQIIGRTVVNEDGATIGRVEDIIVTPEASVSHLIVGAGGFLGVRRHSVAVPSDLFGVSGEQLVLEGATPEMVKALPGFDYAPREASR
jgi:sporulation protein YlmC with PRC-barrel domain